VRTRTVGIEEELLLVDARGDTVPYGEQVRGQAAARSAAGEPVEHEFKLEQVEIACDPVIDLADAATQLRDARRTADQAARRTGARAVALGTSPMPGAAHQTPDERYRRMTERFGAVADQQLTCGQHVHVAVDSRAEGVAVIDRIRDWLPVLRALSANSPFWAGADTRYASYRTVLWGQWPTAGPTSLFSSVQGYDDNVRALIESGAAVDAGMIYFDARLSATFPTVEVRVADVCTSLADSLLLAALCRALVRTAAGQWRSGDQPLGTPVSLLRAAAWRAARFGCTEGLVHPATGAVVPAWQAVASLREHVDGALRADGDGALVDRGLQRLSSGGTGAQRQRAWAGEGSLRAVVNAAAEETVA
jgi:glutamate---cysteine ligase / carboxylate-amine ligase